MAKPTIAQLLAKLAELQQNDLKRYNEILADLEAFISARLS